RNDRLEEDLRAGRPGRDPPRLRRARSAGRRVRLDQGELRLPEAAGVLMRRRDLLGLLAASALDSQAKAWARPSPALKGNEVPSPRFSAGRLKQSACRWPYRTIPLPDLRRAAGKMGLA